MIYEAFEAEEHAIHSPSRSEFRSTQEFLEANREYNLERRAVEARFGEALAEQYLGTIASSRRSAVAAATFRLAWEQGHSNGYSQVESDFEDFAELANLAYAAATS